MLKIWKRTWKEKEDPSRNPQPGQDSEQEAASGGASIPASPLDVGEAAPPAGYILDPILPPRLPRPKRSRKAGDQKASGLSERPYKKPRTDRLPIPDSLGNHLPEFPDVSRTGPHLHSIETLRPQVLAQAQRENTIAVLPLSRSAVVPILAEFLTWAVEKERARPSAFSQQRIALVVVDGETSVDHYVTSLKAENRSIAVKRYPESIHKSGISPWAQLLRQDVVVIPGVLLLDSLVGSNFAITQIHTLVVTDAQDVQDQDPNTVIQIMNDFYRVVDSLSRPRVFALAFPPPTYQFHFDPGMLNLEHTLDAKVVGVSEQTRAEILSLPDRPSEIVILYDAPIHTSETKLFKQLHQVDPSEAIFRHHFKASRYALVEIGPCAADLVWRRALKEIDASIPTWCEDDDDDNGGDGRDVAKLRMRDVIKNWVFTMPNLDSSSRGFNVTSKFLRLVHILKACESAGEGFRGIVFVQRRLNALIIADLLRNLAEQVSFLRPHAVIEHKSPSKPEHLQDVFHSFASGAYNLLIATKSIEDLDIPKASIVIRFDLFESQISNAYVHARARGRESHVVHMVERGNDVQRRILCQVMHLDNDMQRWTKLLRNNTQVPAPPRRLSESTNPYHSDTEDDDCESDEFVKDPTTSGRIYLQDATTVIYRLASISRCQDGEPSGDSPLFQFRDIHQDFGSTPAYVCTIHLPGTTVNGLSGAPQASMAGARRAACYKACVELSTSGLLDYRLFPLPTSLTAAHRSITLDADNDPGVPDNRTTGSQCYPRKQPDFWDNAASAPHTSLYPTIVSTDHLDDAAQPHAPIVILTRQPLPDMASFKIFLSSVPAIVHFRKGAAFEVSETQLQTIYLYTLRICRAIGNKPFTCSLPDVLYFFAPLRLGWEDSGAQLPNIVDSIPWDLLTLAAENWALPLKRGNPEELAEQIRDAVIQDRQVEFTRRYDVVKLRTDLTPLSKPLDSSREENYDNLVEFCKARRKGFDGLQDYGQPIIEVSKVPAVLNRLSPVSHPLTPSPKVPAKYLIPELCVKFTVPASTLRTALLLPSITRRIDDLLLVKELNAKFFNHVISENLLHMAITTPSAGIEYDYERLELLGDAFLKYLSSIYVFVTNPAQTEGALHFARQNIISNKTLLQSSSRSGLPPFIQSKPFAIKFWQPPNFRVITPTRHPKENDGDDLNNQVDGSITVDKDHPSPDVDTGHLNRSTSQRATSLGAVPTTDATRVALPGPQKVKKRGWRKRQLDEQTTQWLGDKAIADVAEAVIGAAYISGGRETALKVTKALNIPIENIDQWSDFGRKALAPPPNVTANMRPGSIAAVESIIGHRFHRPHLLAQALTHASTQGHESTSYERLEFIGDAILDFMLIRHIYDRDQQLSPGALTLLKGAMVSNSALAAVCVWSGLHEHLLLESYNLASTIRVYASQLKAKQAEEYEAARKEGRPPGQYWHDIEAPKALSDMVESIIGAVYVSDNFAPIGVEALFDNVLKPFYDKHVTLKTLSHHPTKILFELFQARGCQQFEILKEKEDLNIRCYIIVHDIVLSSATDLMTSVAARLASLFALDALEGDAGFLTRMCDCRTRSQTKKPNQSKVLEHILSGFGEDMEEAVNKVPIGKDTTSAAKVEGMVVE